MRQRAAIFPRNLIRCRFEAAGAALARFRRSWMSTRRCLPRRCLRLWRCARPASTSMPPSVAVVILRAFSRGSGRRGGSSHSTATHRLSQPGECASHRSRDCSSCMGNSPSSRRWCARKSRERNAMASCSISASPRRSWTTQRAASVSTRTVRSICAWIRRAANQFPHGSRRRASIRCDT